MKRIVVFTAAIGDTDTVRAPLVVDPRVQYVCFSDRPCVEPYVHIPVVTEERPHLAARRIKILADHPILQAANVTLWHDASYRLQGDLQWLAQLRHVPLIALRHPRRTRIEDEAAVVAKYGYVTVETGAAHVARYRAAGFAANVLTASGLLGRRVSPSMRAFNACWWQEVQLWNGRDQTSLDFAAWRSGITVGHLEGTIRANAYADWREAA